MNLCACGCGAEVRNKWVRGHASRGEGGFATAAVRPLPPPDDDFWEDGDGVADLGTLDPDPQPEVEPKAAAPDPVPDYEPGPVLPDPPPAHGKREWRKAKGPRAPKAKAAKVTAGVRADIDAKLSFALEIPGRVWEARDPVCGGTFVAQRPEISAALTEIVCQSPDLVAWFAGGGGQFMLYLNLAAAFWPVITVAMAHHVYHSIEAADDGQAEPDGIRYAA